MKKAMIVVMALLFVGALLADESIDYDSLSLSELLEYAIKGDAVGQFALAARYAYGYGVAQDYKEALKWYRIVAEQGDTFAQYSVGTMYYTGQGVTQDYKEALKWFRLAAEQGDTSAQQIIGLMYLTGLGVVKNVEQAYFWLLIAAANAIGEDFIDISEARDEAGGKLTATQRNRIQQEATAWMCERGFE